MILEEITNTMTMIIQYNTNGMMNKRDNTKRLTKVTQTTQPTLEREEKDNEKKKTQIEYENSKIRGKIMSNRTTRMDLAALRDRWNHINIMRKIQMNKERTHKKIRYKNKKKEKYEPGTQKQRWQQGQ